MARGGKPASSDGVIFSFRTPRMSGSPRYSSIRLQTWVLTGASPLLVQEHPFHLVWGRSGGRLSVADDCFRSPRVGQGEAEVESFAPFQRPVGGPDPLRIRPVDVVEMREPEKGPWNP